MRIIIILIMNRNGITLERLAYGQKGIISAIDAGCPQVQRLMTLGLVEGAEVELASAAIGGDPLEFRLFGRGISLRREQARHFSVATNGSGD
jgi:ferrous iron transport protein A